MAIKVTDPHDLLVYKLSVLLSMEREIERTLPTFEREAQDDELREGFRRHREETARHVENVERAFQILGVEPQGTTVPAMDGLKTQHQGFASVAADDVLPDVLDAVSVGSAAATEHHELAAYEAAITLARGLGLSGVAEILEENLREDEQMLEDTKQIGEKLSKKEAREAAEVDKA